MYKVINWLTRQKYLNWEGALIEDIKTKEKYITNGVFVWKATKEKLQQCEVVDTIDLEKLINRWNKHQGYSELIIE